MNDEEELAQAKTDWWHFHDFNAKQRMKGLIKEAKLLAKISRNNITDNEAFKAANLKFAAWEIHKKAEIADIVGENKEKEWKKVKDILTEYFKIILGKK